MGVEPSMIPLSKPVAADVISTQVAPKTSVDSSSSVSTVRATVPVTAVSPNSTGCRSRNRLEMWTARIPSAFRWWNRIFMASRVSRCTGIESPVNASTASTSKFSGASRSSDSRASPMATSTLALSLPER